MEEGYDDSDGDGDEDMDGYDEDDMSEGPTDSGTEDSNSTGESALEDELLAGEDDWEDEDDEEGGGSGDDEQEMMFDVSRSPSFAFVQGSVADDLISFLCFIRFIPAGRRRGSSQ
jgi:hypothetical protein